MTAMNKIQHWSTREVPAAERFQYFADALASSLLPMRVSAESPSTFELVLAAAEVGPVSVALIQGSAHRAMRAAREVNRSGAHTFHLVVAQAASSRLEHRTSVLLNPGDAVLVDSRYGHDFTLGEKHQNLNLTMQADWLRQWLPAPEALVGKALPRQSGWVHALTAFASGLTPDFIERSPLPRRMLADHLGSLLALVAADLAGGVVEARPAERDLAQRVRECIEERAVEHTLTAAAVAQSLGVSTRTLHRVLTAGGATFGTLVMDARCQRALRMLESPLLDRLSIQEVGWRAGFVDPSHFARVLRKRVGRTPLQIRRQRNS
jgi:AraC-like DNA-binding protein